MIEHLLDHLGYERVDVLGISWGGGLAQQLAHQAPQRVRRLVLAATAPGVPGLGGVPGRPSALINMLNPRRYRDPDYLASVAGRLYRGGAFRLPEGHFAARLGKPPSSRGYRHQLWAVQCWTGLPWLRSLEQSTLVLTGDDDPLVPVANGQILARLIPRARLVSSSSGVAVTCSCCSWRLRWRHSLPTSSWRPGQPTDRPHARFSSASTARTARSARWARPAGCWLPRTAVMRDDGRAARMGRPWLGSRTLRSPCGR